MNHPELDELLGLVRDDEEADDIRQHVELCAQCTAELDAAARLDTAAALIGPALRSEGLVAPPRSVWDQIQAEVESDPAVVVTRSRGTGRVRRSLLVAAAAAVAGVMIGGVGGYLLADDADESSVPIAVGTLTPEGQDAVTGEVSMSQDASSRLLTVAFSQAVAGPGYVEAWLLDPSTNEMLGLGVLGPDGGTVTVPADADLSRFTTVDISREPFDGDPAHSADSIARGVLRQV